MTNIPLGTTSKSKTTGRKNTLFDCIFLGFVVLLSLILYVGKIGFYSDDWSFLGNFSVASDQSFTGLLHSATTPNTQMRPVQNIYDTLLYMIFHFNPLGYQIVNALVLITLTLLFYLNLKQLKFPRIIALAIPLVYTFLPTYSTDKFWYASFQINLSMLLYFLSLLTGLRSFDYADINSFRYKLTSILSLFLSILSYEITLPLFLFNLILFWKVKKAKYK